jgi:glycosyltransferase involved in cell wall biosynthesis
MARFNPWIEATIASGPVIDVLFAEHPELIDNFDLVHFTCPYASKQWVPKFRVLMPCVTSHHHTSDWDLLKHNLDGDAIIVGSPEWTEDLKKRGADTSNVFCVPYGVDADLFRPATSAGRARIRNKLKLKDEVLVGFFGKNSSNECDRKGIDVFIEAVKQLHQRIEKLAVLIIGPGWDELLASLKSSGIACIWIPYVGELEGLSEMYHALDFYWVTSRVEGGPVTLLEAMSSEVCCLTTPVGIAREIVRDGQNAVLLPFNDAEAFADHTAKLISDLDKRRQLARNARQTILDEMHLAVTATRLRDVYEKAFERFNIRAKGVNAGLPAYRTSTDAQLAATDVLLNGFPRAMHRRVEMLEALSWAEHLVLYQNQSRLAAKMIARECWRNPMSLVPPRVFLRRFLPVRLVATAVKLRRRSQGPANSYAR